MLRPRWWQLDAPYDGRVDTWFWVVILLGAALIALVIVGAVRARNRVDPTDVSLDPALVAKVRSQYRKGDKLGAVKALRAATGLGLADAVRIVDKLGATAKPASSKAGPSTAGPGRRWASRRWGSPADLRDHRSRSRGRTALAGGRRAADRGDQDGAHADRDGTEGREGVRRPAPAPVAAGVCASLGWAPGATAPVGRRVCGRAWCAARAEHWLLGATGSSALSVGRRGELVGLGVGRVRCAARAEHVVAGGNRILRAEQVGLTWSRGGAAGLTDAVEPV